MNPVILDNWTFQTIGELFEGGLSQKHTKALVVKGNKHAYEAARIADLQMKALVDLLTNIILRDEFKIDEGFVHAWSPFAELFAPVLEADLITFTDPPKHGEDIANGTAFIVKQLCVTSSLKRIQSINENHFAAHKSSKYPYQSQLVWGTAGMLSRSNVFNAPYVGHPLRQRFLESTGSFSGRGDVVKDVVELVHEKRAAIYAGSTSAMDLKYAELVIPAVAIPVITKADKAERLIQLAVDERDKNKKLRTWFSTFTSALAQGDTISVAKHRKDLNLLARDVDRLVGRSSSPSVSMGISASGPSLSMPVGEWLRSLFGRYSIRHDLMKQVKATGNTEAHRRLRQLLSS